MNAKEAADKISYEAVDCVAHCNQMEPPGCCYCSDERTSLSDFSIPIIQQAIDEAVKPWKERAEKAEAEVNNLRAESIKSRVTIEHDTQTIMAYQLQTQNLRTALANLVEKVSGLGKTTTWNDVDAAIEAAKKFTEAK